MRIVDGYASKDEIYRDYPVAVRLFLSSPISWSDYDRHLPLALGDEIKLEKYSELVKNFRAKHPVSTSIGFCLEVPVKGDAGKVYDTKVVLLGHETGAELFIAIAKAAAAWIGKKAADTGWDAVVEPALVRVLELLKTKFYPAIRGGIRIDRVEIRTAKKGVLALPWSEFNSYQLRCLALRFHSIKKLSEVTRDCFKDARSVTYRPNLIP
jgi:hypothetical protein